VPWINVNYSRKLALHETDEIKSEFAEIMKAVFDKNESGLVVSFAEPYVLYRGGTATQEAVVLDVRYIGQFSLEKKRELMKRFTECLSRVLRVDPQEVTLLFSEMDSQNWGRGAGDFS
jgi:phenylpyruvate tautomerase PptA (4-oxalocrotonate tautomerase family)